jgi:hypothetical protein
VAAASQAMKALLNETRAGGLAWRQVPANPFLILWSFRRMVFYILVPEDFGIFFVIHFRFIFEVFHLFWFI